jgi:DNA-binding XRE family transcriptional regulator
LLTSEQVRAARALKRMDQTTLAEMAGVSVETVKRLEKLDGPLLSANGKTMAAIQSALEGAGIIFIDSNGNGPGVRLRDPV